MRYIEKWCRYCGHYKPAKGFIPVRNEAGKLVGSKCPDCQEKEAKEGAK